MYMRLLEEGHDVRVTVTEPLACRTMAGLVPRAKDWREELPWIRESGRDGLLIFEAVGFGELQDQLRREGLQVIGGSAFGDRLENDRAMALKLLSEHGLRLAPVREFRSVEEAIEDLAKRPRRCVYKRCHSAGDTFIGSDAEGRDIAALLRNAPPSNDAFILMDFIEGVETGVGAYFNGEHFLRPACLDWEHKRFFPGDMGELTGEMGTVATFDLSDRIFKATLEPLEQQLHEAGHVGWVNLNTIINEEGIWPIEFTCRFGYPGFAVLEPLQAAGWGELFEKMLGKDARRFPTNPGFSVCVVLTTPPFPYSRHELQAPVGLPVFMGEADPSNVHLGEVGLIGSQLVTTGVYGWTAVATGTGLTVPQAKAAAYEVAAKVSSTNMRYRMDIGDEIPTALDRLRRWGWIEAIE
jgi:phosphoribosylamine--glycine ligase